MTNLENEAEKMLKKSIKKGEMKVLDSSIIEEIFDDVHKEMEDYRIDENYRAGISSIDIEKVPPFYDNLD